MISTAELKELIASGADCRIFDCSVAMMPTQEDAAIAFQKEHIKGARFLDLKLTRDLGSPYPFMMPNKGFFSLLARQFDIRKSLPVVVYDCQSSAFAHRAAFMLKSFGHDNVRVLDGGIAKWKADGGAVHSSGAPSAGDYDYDIVPGVVNSFEEVKSLSETGGKQIIDCRPADAFAKGTIPGGVNISGTDFQHPDGSVKSVDEIKAIFGAAGVDLSKPMLFSCNSGIKATVAFAAASQAGATGALSVYDGSWSEWSAKI